jgi:nicotinamidase-related amidase
MPSFSRPVRELPVPGFYDPAHAARWDYTPDQQALSERAVEWRERHALIASAEDAARVHLVLIDLQKDFCFPEGTLYVGWRSGRGALEDNDRTARFIYRNLGALTEITCTLDTHYPLQIFSPAFWLDEEGKQPPAHSQVTLADLRAGRLRPNPAVARWVAGGDEAWLRRQVEYYCEELERGGRYTLYLWPPHCIAGSEGHALAGVIHEARLFHSYARLAPAQVAVKGEHPLTEFYSAIHAEVPTTFDGKPLAAPNITFLEALGTADAVILAGQAASHCVRSTADDLLAHLDKEALGKIYLLTDCMTSIAVPSAERPGEFVVDFTPQAEAAFERFAEAGMHLVQSTTPLAEWPGFPL